MTRALAAALLLLVACKKEPAPPPARVQEKHEEAPQPKAAAGEAAMQPMGGALNVAADAAAESPAIAVGADGSPVVAWRERGDVHVKRWVRAQWELLGKSPSNRAHETVAVAADGESLLLAWRENNLKDVAGLVVARFEGGEWKWLGGALSNGPPALDTQLAVSSLGPTVAWRERGADKVQLYARAFIGGEWKPLGALPAGDIRVAPAIAGVAGHPPVIGWLERVEGGVAARVRRWDAAKGEWAALPEPPGADGDSTLALSMDESGALWLALGFNAGMRPLMTLAPGAAAWAEQGLPQKLDGYVSNPSLCAGGGGAALGIGFGARVSLRKGGAWRLAKWEKPLPDFVSPAVAASKERVFATASFGDPKQLFVYGSTP